MKNADDKVEYTIDFYVVKNGNDWVVSSLSKKFMVSTITKPKRLFFYVSYFTIKVIYFIINIVKGETKWIVKS